MSVYVEWKPFYSVGDAAIDAEHRQILEILNELYAALEESPNHPAAADLWKRLLQYTKSHFKHEERILAECGYSDLPQHAAQHDRLRQRTVDLQMHANLVTSRDLLRFVKEWWVAHIQAEDKKYTPYLTASTAV